MALVRLLAGLRRFGPRAVIEVPGSTVAAVLAHGPIPAAVLYPDGAGLNSDIAILVNGRNIVFLDGLATAVGANDRITIFLHGARGYPGG